MTRRTSKSLSFKNRRPIPIKGSANTTIKREEIVNARTKEQERVHNLADLSGAEILDALKSHVGTVDIEAGLADFVSTAKENLEETASKTVPKPGELVPDELARTITRYETVSKEELTVEEAVALIKANTSAKFDETVEIAMNLGVDPRHADQMVRGVVGLPNGTGKTVRVAVFARGAKADEATAAGADIVGAEDLMETVQGGTIEFDRCIATPDMMPIVGRLDKVLGPRNLMPNPKVGTVTMDVEAAVKAAKGGEVLFKAEKGGVVHAGVGKLSFDEAKLVENIRAFVGAVSKAKPAGTKGAYMKKIALSSSKGPGVMLKLSDDSEFEHYDN